MDEVQRIVDGDALDMILSRAEAEASEHRLYLAYAIYMDAYARLAPAISRTRGKAVLAKAAEICRRELEPEAEERITVADALLALSPDDGSALRLRGACRARRAEAEWLEGRRANAVALAEDAARDLERAVTVFPFDNDARASLGGVYKRLAAWKKSLGDAAEARSLLRKVVAIYDEASRRAVDAYPLLNFLEYRAILERDPAIVRTEDERDRLGRALHLRLRQHQRREDLPWCVFDLARGQHYLRPDVSRFLRDIAEGIRETRGTARGKASRSMIASAARSLRDLHEAEVSVPGLDDALLLLRRAEADDTWDPGTWPALSSAQRELEATAEIARSVREAHARTEERLMTYLAKAERQWSREDERKFEDELQRFKREIAPREVVWLRVLWKAFGGTALETASMATGVAGAVHAAKLAQMLIDRATAAEDE